VTGIVKQVTAIRIGGAVWATVIIDEVSLEVVKDPFGSRQMVGIVTGVDMTRELATEFFEVGERHTKSNPVGALICAMQEVLVEWSQTKAEEPAA
jgi:hypothetical protein